MGWIVNHNHLLQYVNRYFSHENIFCFVVYFLFLSFFFIVQTSRLHLPRNLFCLHCPGTGNTVSSPGWQITRHKYQCHYHVYWLEVPVHTHTETFTYTIYDCAAGVSRIATLLNCTSINIHRARPFRSVEDKKQIFFFRFQPLCVFHRGINAFLNSVRMVVTRVMGRGLENA